MKAPPRPEMMPLIHGKLKARGYLGEKEVGAVADRLRLPASRVFGFASQFPEFPLRPWRARVSVCVGPACASAGAWEAYEDLKRVAPGGVEVVAEPGMLRPHRSPAVCVEVAGEEARIAEGLDSAEAARLAAELAEKNSLSLEGTREAPIPVVEALPGHGPSPWAAAAAGGDLPPAWGLDLARWAREHPGDVMLAAGLHEARVDKGPGVSPVAETLVCDTVGREPESSADFAVSLLHPRAVVAGAALAAAACGARRLVFYVPWNEETPGEEFESAAAELLAGTGIRHAVLRGPVHVPCTRDLGMAAVANGMMLWRAASLYGRRGTMGADPPLAVIGAEATWRLLWMVGGEGALDRERPHSRLVCLVGPGDAPRFLEVPSRSGLEEIVVDAGAAGESLKALYAGGRVARAALRGDAEVTDRAGEIVLLGAGTCAPRLALNLARSAEVACCGGCVPGRTAPAVAVRLLNRVLEGGEGEAALEELRSLLSGVGGLALCLRLEEVLRPVRDCLQEFDDEFDAHAREGACKSGSCPPTLEASTHRG